MGIEHRWAPRQPAGLPVTIACRSFGLLRGRLRNISNGGALVQLQTPIPPNVPVEFILPTNPASSTGSFRLPAIVIRCDPWGVGLMFDRVDPDTWSALLAHVAARHTAGTEPAAKPAIGASARWRG